MGVYYLSVMAQMTMKEVIEELKNEHPKVTVTDTDSDGIYVDIEGGFQCHRIVRNNNWHISYMNTTRTDYIFAIIRRD